MASKSSQKQTSQPTPQANAAANAVLGYYLGNQAPAFLPTQDQPLGTYYNQGVYAPPAIAQPKKTVVNTLNANGGSLGPVTQIPGVNKAIGDNRSSVAPAQYTTSGVAYPIGAPADGRGAGNFPGTLFPDYQSLIDRSNMSFFGELAGDNPNPIFANALDTIQGGGSNGLLAAIMSTGSGSGGSLDVGSLPQQFGPDLVTTEQAQQAVEGLLNAPSIFDEVGSGGYADVVNQRAQEFYDAQMARGSKAIDDLTEQALGDIAAQSGGLISSSQMLNTRQQIVEDVTTELEAINSGVALDNTKFLFEAALQDAALGTDRLRTVIEGALTEKGIDQAFASSIAQAQAEIIKSREANKLNALVSAYNAQLGANVDILNLGLQDYGDTTDRFLGTSMKPINDVISIATGMPSISTGSSKSKSL